MMGVAILGLVPDLRSLGRYDSWVRRRHLGRGVELTPGALAREGPEQLPERTGKLDPRAVAFDAYRTIRTNVMLSQPGEQPRVVLFTSAATGEGKTATVLNTAIMFAHTGARVLVIDADLRNPTCHQVLHHPGEPGLSDTLTGLIEFGQAVQTTESPVDLLPAGRLPPNPAELLGSEVMRKLLDSVRPAYDYVLIDSAPIMSVPDSVLLSTFTDGVVLVVDQKNTSRHQVRNALTRLDFARVRVLGVVLNRLDIRDVLPIHPSY